MTWKDRRRRGRIIPVLIACFYAGIAVGWWIHAAIGGRDRPAEAVDATAGDSSDPPAPAVSTVSEAPRAVAPVAATETIGADPFADVAVTMASSGWE